MPRARDNLGGTAHTGRQIAEEPLDRVRVDVADNVSASGVIDDAVPGVFAADLSIGTPIVGEDDRIRIDVGPHGSTKRLATTSRDHPQPDPSATLDHPENGWLGFA